MAVVSMSVFRSRRNRPADRPTVDTPAAATIPSAVLATAVLDPLPSKTTSTASAATARAIYNTCPQKNRTAW
jgi:hypothetical protein